jgi:hypothetical protein
MKEIRLRLWVDIEDSLPFGAETELVVGRGLLTGYREVRAHFTSYDIRWGVAIDPTTFVPDIPADYERIDIPWFGKGADSNER